MICQETESITFMFQMKSWRERKLEIIGFKQKIYYFKES